MVRILLEIHSRKLAVKKITFFAKIGLSYWTNFESVFIQPRRFFELPTDCDRSDKSGT